MTEATIRNRTLIVPRTICNGPVITFLPRTPDGVGRLPSALRRRGHLVVRALVRTDRGRRADLMRALLSAMLRTIARGLRGYSPVTVGAARR